MIAVSRTASAEPAVKSQLNCSVISRTCRRPKTVGPSKAAWSNSFAGSCMLTERWSEFEKAGDFDSLIRRAQRYICGVGCVFVVMTWPLTAVNDRLLRTGKSRLVNANAANQIKTATANESDFEERIMTDLILNARIVLLNVGRAEIAIEGDLQVPNSLSTGTCNSAKTSGNVDRI